MNIQWQARVFHSFSQNRIENIIIYNVPYSGNFDAGKVKTFPLDNGKILNVCKVDGDWLRAEVGF